MMSLLLGPAPRSSLPLLRIKVQQSKRLFLLPFAFSSYFCVNLLFLVLTEISTVIFPHRKDCFTFVHGFNKSISEKLALIFFFFKF